ncbi:hypothetical protein EDD11_010198 [Mortierella claussenii]|nr:hypothetical protein EDD11_010198 [Mortierella claussenii]
MAGWKEFLNRIDHGGDYFKGIKDPSDVTAQGFFETLNKNKEERQKLKMSNVKYGVSMQLHMHKDVLSSMGSEERRFQKQSSKWILKSGIVVEDVLFQAASELVKRQDDWAEICSDLPQIPPYNQEAADYIDTFEDTTTKEQLEQALETRPRGLLQRMIYECLQAWQGLLEEDDPSPFDISESLSECWWDHKAWGMLLNLTRGVPKAYMIPGEVTSHDSAARRNSERSTLSSVPSERKRLGYRADLIWRTMSVPERDWAIVEAAKAWDTIGTKYLAESNHKLPRQLHDILVARSMEVGGPGKLWNVLVSGFVTGGTPVFIFSP